MSVKQDDEMFHVYLYKWLIKQHLTEKLLEVSIDAMELVYGKLLSCVDDLQAKML